MLQHRVFRYAIKYVYIYLIKHKTLYFVLELNITGLFMHLSTIIDWDKELLLYLNSKHYDWLDPIMLGLSSFTSWTIVCLLIIFFMIYKGGVWRKSAPVFLVFSVGACIVLTNILKLFVARARPIHIEAWSDILHAIEEYESSYSFFSSHSSSSYCMAVFSLLFFRNKIYTCAILSWATAVAYSRIYLAKHYPLDILCGMAFGIMIGILGYKIFERYKASRL